MLVGTATIEDVWGATAWTASIESFGGFWGVANLLLSRQGDCLQPPLWMYGVLPLWRVLDNDS
jgi:hypothetical protein